LPDNRPFTVLSLALVHLINFLVACDEPFNSILRASDTATEYQVRVKRSLLRSIPCQKAASEERQRPVLTKDLAQRRSFQLTGPPPCPTVKVTGVSL
jgi:hypothetical protein